MRPGQTAPVFPRRAPWSAAPQVRFNEAGADCPGIPGGSVDVGRSQILASMRPGQTAPVFLDLHKRDFAAKYASMRPGQTAPVFPPHKTVHHSGALGASMRPGQTAPVFRPPHRPPRPCRPCFNEAGADCPGIPPPLFVLATILPSSFNEAGADCPGIPYRTINLSSL